VRLLSLNSFKGKLIMEFPSLPFTVTAWADVEPVTLPGEQGSATIREFNRGELISELKDGRTFRLGPGMSYQVSDFGDAPHRSTTTTGAKLFIVD
jgi:hypothetical protein